MFKPGDLKQLMTSFTSNAEVSDFLIIYFAFINGPLPQITFTQSTIVVLCFLDVVKMCNLWIKLWFGSYSDSNSNPVGCLVTIVVPE